MTVGVALQDLIGQLLDFFSNKTGRGHLKLFSLEEIFLWVYCMVSKP